VTSPPTPVIGITGPVAAGKSALSGRLASIGARVIDVDGLGHRALDTPQVRDEVVAAFGKGVLAADGSVDRARLAREAFSGGGPRTRLEAIVHPHVRRAIDEEIRRAVLAGAAAVVVDCALLFESGLDAMCDFTVAVDAPEPVRLARALAAHGWDEAEVGRRMAAQLTPASKKARADRLVVNDGDSARLDDEARAILEEALTRTRASEPRRTRS
jgi:dephospho-CoA kinase